MAEKRERDSSEEIRKHLMQYGVNKENPAYLVRGAELVCSQGTNKRMMNLNKCHGVYIKEHAVVHELDCIQGDEENITWFGVCNPGEGLETDDIELIGDNGEKCHGKKCKPYLIGTWYESFEGTRIVDNGDKKQEDGEEPEGCNTITTDSFLVCKYGGIIMPVNSGQDREVSADEFDYDTEEEREAALARVQEPCEEEIDREEGCEDLLHAKLSENDEWSTHGSEFQSMDAAQNEKSEGIMGKYILYPESYMEGILKNYEKHKMIDGRFVLDNGGKTIAYGHDVKVEAGENFSGGLSEEEGTKLAVNDLDSKYELICRYIDTLNTLHGKNINIEDFTENEILFLLDFAYNRGSGLVERPELEDAGIPYHSLPILIVAVSEGDDETIKKH